MIITDSHDEVCGEWDDGRLAEEYGMGCICNGIAKWVGKGSPAGKPLAKLTWIIRNHGMMEAYSCHTLIGQCRAMLNLFRPQREVVSGLTFVRCSWCVAGRCRNTDRVSQLRFRKSKPQARHAIANYRIAFQRTDYDRKSEQWGRTAIIDSSMIRSTLPKLTVVRWSVYFRS